MIAADPLDADVLHLVVDLATGCAESSCRRRGRTGFGRLIRVPVRLIRHARGIDLRLPPGEELLDEILARIRAPPAAR